MPYEELSSKEIIKTLGVIKAVLETKFPSSGLLKIANKILVTAQSMNSDIKEIQKPIIWLRVLNVIFTILILLCGGFLLYLTGLTILSHLNTFADLDNFLQGLEAVISTLVLLGGALFFTISAEQKFKRRKALQKLYLLRSYTHVIDLHQLKKDPSVIWTTEKLSPDKLTEYLDYCSDLLNILGKMAAYYEKDIDDEEVREASFDIENLASNLSRKIWQKIMILSMNKRK